VRLEVFAVEDTSIQLSWGALGPGPVVVRAADTRVEVVADGGPGAVSLGALPADRTVTVELHGEGVPGGRIRLATRTLATPPGDEMYRLATISDLHIGATTFGYLHTIAETDPADPHPQRCTRGALREAVAWGAQRIVVKGDVVDQGHPGAWRQAGHVLAGALVPVDVLPGNHETKRRRTVEPEDALRAHGLHVVRGVSAQDLPGVRLVLADSAQVGDDRGRLDHLTEDLVRVLRGASAGALLLMHHHPARTAVPLGWPLGIPRSEATRVLDRIGVAHPATLVSTGHVHRNRRWRHGPLNVTSVGSVKDYPGVWAGYVVHEGGIRQVVRRVAEPDLLRWTDRSARAAFGAWGLWSPGLRSHRCFSHTWPR
jgi:hypothetical protein